MGYLAEGIYIAAVCLVSHLLHKRLGVKASTARKLTHILIGAVFFLQYAFFRDDPLGMLLVPSLVTVGLFLVARFRLVPSLVNPENPYGIFLYALAILVSNVISIAFPAYHAAAGAAILALSLGDGAAALGGSHIKRPHRLFREKTLEGSALCLAFSLLGMLLPGLIFPSLALSPWLLLPAALLATVLELYTGRLDNLAIVFGVGSFVYLLMGVEEAILIRLTVGSLLGLFIVFLTVRRGMLTLPAATAALLMLLAILGLAGYREALYLILLFLVAGLVHSLNKRIGNRHTDGARALRQVLANGAPALLLLILFGLFGMRALLIGYFAALAEFLADTMASDVGTLSRREPFDLCRMKRIPRGRSGGVSLLGTLSALLASLLAAALSLCAGLSLFEAAAVLTAAFLGVLADSILGSLLQAKYRCCVCGAYTEKPTHCEVAAEKTGGLRLLTNSGVNLLSSLLAGAVALLLCM